MARSRFPFFRILFFLIILGGLGFASYLFLYDLDGPQISVKQDIRRLALTQNITLILEDSRSNIKAVTVNIRRSSGSTKVFEKVFPTAEPRQEVTFSLENAQLRDGMVELEVIARDTALAGFGRGNSTTLKSDVYIDLYPPRLTIKSSAPYLKRGSITVAAFSVSEPTVEAGIRVGDIVFPAFLQNNGLYYCMFGFPLDMPLAEFKPELFARDQAGNLASVRLQAFPQERKYAKDVLNISDSFLKNKSNDFLEILPEPGLTDLQRYIKINNDVRKIDAEMLSGLADKTRPDILWEGSFVRLPRSALRASYGDNRSYVYNGDVVDKQTHMGIDLASVANAPIPAGNHGIVVFAGFQGIYGNLVVIDHGLGLMSLYSHMNTIAVNEGDEVKKGQIIAHTGTTGLAGGDHLHFGMLLHGREMQPTDWLDQKWIQDTITDRLNDAAKR